MKEYRDTLLRELRSLIQADQPKASYLATWAWSVQFANEHGAGRNPFSGVTGLRPSHLSTAIHMYEEGVR